MAIIKDIQTEIREIDNTDRSVRKFAIAFFILTVIVGFFLWYHDYLIWYYLPASGFVLLAVSFLYCPFVRWIYYPLAVLGIILGFFISKIILMLMYYTLFSFVGLFTRLFGIDLLKKKIRKNQTSYWDQHEKISSDPKQYEQLF
jgi:hypothetical protein